MDSGPPVSDHEEELGVREQLGQVDGALERERVLVAQPLGGVSVLDDHLQDEGRDRFVQDLPRKKNAQSANRPSEDATGRAPAARHSPRP